MLGRLVTSRQRSSTEGGELRLSAYSEFESTGVAGPETLAMLLRCVRQVERRTSFPPPGDHAAWTVDACWDLLSEMFASAPAAGRTFVVGCFLTATDDASFERLVLAAIENHLKDEAKKTERGKLRRRLETLLSADSRFVRGAGSGGAWALSENAGAVWQGDRNDLVQAAFTVPGAIERLNPAGPTPAATRATLLGVAHAVLSAAGGAVRDEDLARVFQERFVLLRPPIFTTLESDGGWEPPSPADHPSDEQLAGDATVASATALTLWASLSAVERALVPILGEPEATLATAAGVRPRQAAAIRAAVQEKLRLAVVESDDAGTLLADLLQLCTREE